MKYSGQGSFRVKKGTIDKLLFLLKTIGIYPLQVSMILCDPVAGLFWPQGHNINKLDKGSLGGVTYHQISML